MRNPVAKAWCCVGIMMLGVVLMMTSLAFLNTPALMYLFMIIGIAVFIGGVVLHYVIVRCPHCGSHLGRLYGPRCPFCGKEYNKAE
ncbi:MAG: hypothetical protein IKH82_03440 [Clostridiales bacterium]|nr:hypothetical protein [Clostridiales bacterium]